MKNDKDDVDLFFLQLQENIQNTLNALKQDLSKINIGRAQSDIFDLVMVDYYGSKTLLPHMSVISVLDFNKVCIEPYEKSALKAIEKAIRESGLDVNPQIQGNVINIYFPQMTLERRDKLIKLCKAHGEKAKVAIRNHRHVGIDGIKGFNLGTDITNIEIRNIEIFIKKIVNEIEDLVDAKNKKLFNMR
jgi:ribosome recycling factor